MKHVNVHVSGKVQGVFFRASAKEEADRLGVSGFVRNESNGDVHLEAEGDEDNLKEFLDWCARGPSRSRVDQLSITEDKVSNYHGFEVRR